MTAKDVLYYQFGNAEAIRRVAGNRYLVAVGAALVLITSVPRNYDQTYIGEVPWWPVIPLLFSFVSGSFLFWVLERGFIKDAEGDSARSKYWMFLGLFWMTGPVAWLYGIPVERFLTVRGAAVANLWLLGIVAAWRVVLMTRAMSVVYQVPWVRAGGWVLLGACLEVAIVLFFTGFGEALGRGMAGMRNSPEQDLIVRVLGTVFWASVITVPLLLILLNGALKESVPARMAELPSSRRAPWFFLLGSAVVWVVLAVQPQRELAKEWKYVTLLERSDTRDALAYLNTLEPADWPPAKSFRPDPYEFEVWRWLPVLMEQVTGKEKRWVQEKLLWVFERTFDHRFQRFSGEDYLKILKGVEKFEGGEEWIRNSGALWKKRPSSARETNVAEYLDGKGVMLRKEEEKKERLTGQEQ